MNKGKFVYAGDNIILVDGENSGEVFAVPQDGYMGSTFKQLWLSSVMWKSYILAFIRKHSKKCTFYTLRFGCSFAAVNTIKPQLL